MDFSVKIASFFFLKIYFGINNPEIKVNFKIYSCDIVLKKYKNIKYLTY